MKSTASYQRQFKLLQKCWLQLKKGWNEYYDPVLCCNHKTWGLIISTEQTTFSLSVCADCLPACTGFLIKLQNFDWVQLKWFLSGLLLRFPWSLNCWQQQPQTSHLNLTVVEFSDFAFEASFFFNASWATPQHIYVGSRATKSPLPQLIKRKHKAQANRCLWTLFLGVERVGSGSVVVVL